MVGLIAYGGTIVRAAQVWSSNADEQHGYLVIPITLLLFYLRRSEFPVGTARLDPRGLLLLAVAAGMKIYGELYLRPWMDMWSLPIWIGGVVWLLGGFKILRWAAPVIAFLFFMSPLPGQLQTAAGYPLQLMAATGAGWMLQAIGQPGFVAGTTILLGDHVLDVERACAGLRMFQGMSAVAFAWSLFCRYSWPRFLCTMALAPVIAIVVNILRIVVTGLLFQWAGTESAETFAHDWAGVMMIPLGALIFFLVQGVTDHLVAWHRDQPEHRLITGMVALIACLVVAAGGYAMHARQQQRAIGLVLRQARELGRSDQEDDRVRAIAYYQRYLSLRGQRCRSCFRTREAERTIGRRAKGACSPPARARLASGPEPSDERDQRVGSASWAARMATALGALWRDAARTLWGGTLDRDATSHGRDRQPVSFLFH